MLAEGEEEEEGGDCTGGGDWGMEGAGIGVGGAGVEIGGGAKSGSGVVGG